MSSIFKNTIVTFSIIKFPGKRSVSVFPQISISWIQFMNISPSKTGQKSKFIIQGIIYSYLSRSLHCTYITNGIPIAPFFWRKSTYPRKGEKGREKKSTDLPTCQILRKWGSKGRGRELSFSVASIKIQHIINHGFQGLVNRLHLLKETFFLTFMMQY